MKINTVPYKGSKRKLLENILSLTREVKCKTFFDGFSGSGIVSAFMRHNGYVVSSNDKMPSCHLYSKVFLEGFNQEQVTKHIDKINSISPKVGWLTNNYSGSKARKIRGTNGSVESRPLGFIVSNAMKLDAARDYAESIQNDQDRSAVIFSIIIAANKVFNNSNDQKSCLKKWTAASQKDVVFSLPTYISGHKGASYNSDIVDIKNKEYDVVYLDPPYTTGVLYDACYHLNDSLCLWDKPNLDIDYAIPRPERAVFKNSKPGRFYSKQKSRDQFHELLGMFDCQRIILSYSDAPRNVLSFEELKEICERHGKLKIHSKSHKICTQANSLNKKSTSLEEYFFVIDKTKG